MLKRKAIELGKNAKRSVAYAADDDLADVPHAGGLLCSHQTLFLIIEGELRSVTAAV